MNILCLRGALMISINDLRKIVILPPLIFNFSLDQLIDLLNLCLISYTTFYVPLGHSYNMVQNDDTTMIFKFPNQTNIFRLISNSKNLLKLIEDETLVMTIL